MEDKLVNPEFYTSLDYTQVKNEIKSVMDSDMPPQEAKKRIVALERQLLRRYIR